MRSFRRLPDWIRWLLYAFMLTALVSIVALYAGYRVKGDRLANAGSFASGVASAAALLVASVAIAVTQYNASAVTEASRQAWHSVKRLEEALHQYGAKVDSVIQLRAPDFTSTSGTYILLSASSILLDALQQVRASGAIRYFYGKRAMLTDDPEHDVTCAYLLLMLEAHLSDDVAQEDSAIKDNALLWGAVLLAAVAGVDERELQDIWFQDLGTEGRRVFELRREALAREGA